LVRRRRLEGFCAGIAGQIRYQENHQRRQKPRHRGHGQWVLPSSEEGRHNQAPVCLLLHVITRSPLPTVSEEGGWRSLPRDPHPFVKQIRATIGASAPQISPECPTSSGLIHTLSAGIPNDNECPERWPLFSATVGLRCDLCPSCCQHRPALNSSRRPPTNRSEDTSSLRSEEVRCPRQMALGVKSTAAVPTVGISGGATLSIGKVHV